MATLAHAVVCTFHSRSRPIVRFLIHSFIQWTSLLLSRSTHQYHSHSYRIKRNPEKTMASKGKRKCRVPSGSGNREKVGNFWKPVQGREKIGNFKKIMLGRERVWKIKRREQDIKQNSTSILSNGFCCYRAAMWTTDERESVRMLGVNKEHIAISFIVSHRF